MTGRRDASARLLTVDQVAERLNVSVAYVRRRLIFEQRIEYMKIGRHVRFDEAALEAFIIADGFVTSGGSLYLGRMHEEIRRLHLPRRKPVIPKRGTPHIEAITCTTSKNVVQHVLLTHVVGPEKRRQSAELIKTTRQSFKAVARVQIPWCHQQKSRVTAVSRSPIGC